MPVRSSRSPSDRWRVPKSPVLIPARAAERAATRYEVVNGCWISTYSVASHGYAQIGWHSRTLGGRQMTTAHRAAWVHHSGEQIPTGQTVDHTCKNRRCVNPAHLRVMSNFENARRTSGRDWPVGQCANGHSNEHLRFSGSHWHCPICSREQNARYRAKFRATKAKGK